MPAERVDTAAPETDDGVYVLVPSRHLPRIDPNKTIKQVVLTARQLPRFNRFVRRWRHLITLSYWAGVALGTCTLFLPSRYGVWLAIVSMPLQFVPSLVSLMVMRYDMAVLVARGYEFWYLTLSNVVVSTLISFSFNDARCMVLVGAAVAFETALLLDANHRASRLVSLATVLGALTNVAYLVCATLGVIEYGRDLELVRYKHRVLYADDATANLIATLVVLLVRNGVRKFSHTNDKLIVSCITHRCPVALVPEKKAAAHLSANSQRSLSSSSSSSPTAAAYSSIRRRQVPLQYVKDGEKFVSTNLLFKRAVHALVLRPGFITVYSRVLHAASWVSLVAWVTAALAMDHAVVSSASVVALTGSAVVFFSYLILLQRQLLHRLFTSFDFVFLSVQFTIAHLCLADIVQWSDPRSLVVLASWLWTHWVLLLDGVLPVHKDKRHLHFRTHVAIAVLVLFVAEQLLVGTAIVFLDNDDDDPRLALRDRIVFTLPLRGRVKQLRVVPLLFGRMVATLSWSLRLLWRLRGRREQHELLLLQGNVQYENTALTSMGSMQVLRKHSTIAQVVPMPLADDRRRDRLGSNSHTK